MKTDSHATSIKTSSSSPLSLLKRSKPFIWRTHKKSHLFFDVFYTGLTYEGEDGERDYVKNSDVLYFKTFREGSTITHEFDFKAEVHLNLKNGRGNLTSYNREPSLLFKKKWQKSIQVSFDCERIR